MARSADEFGRRVHDLLALDPGLEGRERVRLLLEEWLRDREFVEAHVTDDHPQRRVLYQDAELGFVVLGHVFREARRTKPHDHGSTWAIYGQAEGTTFMDEWELVERAEPGKPGKVRKVTTYALTPGHAHTYNEGVLHSPWREGPAKMIRIEGGPIDSRREHELTVVDDA